MAPDRSTTPWRLTVVGLLILILGIWPIIGAVSLGSLEIPHNDAWSYGLMATSFAETGHWQLFGWNRPALVGQVLVAWPFHLLPVDPTTANHLSVVAWGCLLLALTATLTWRTCGYRRALLATLVMGLWPGFALLAMSFMTDLPSAAAALFSVVLGVESLRRSPGSLPLLAGAVAVGFWAVTIREQALVAPVAVLAAAWIYLPRRRRQVFALAGLLLVAVALFEVWRRSLPYDDPPAGGLRLGLLDSAIAGSGVLGLALLPITIHALARRGLRGTRDRWFALPALGWALAWIAVFVWSRLEGRPFRLPGNYVDRIGAYAHNGVGARPAILSSGSWQVVLVVAIVASIVLVGELAARLHRLMASRHEPGEDGPALGLVALAGFGGVAAIVLPALLGQYPYDRYWLGVAAPVAVLLLAPRLDGRRQPVSLPVAGLAVATTVALGAWSILVAGNAWAYDAARWRLAEQVSADLPAHRVDAGLEWVGSHASEPAQPFRHPTRGQLSWPTSMFPGSLSCVVITADEGEARAWGDPVLVRTVDRLGWFGSVDRVAAYHTGACD